MFGVTVGADPEFVTLACTQGKWSCGEVGTDGAGAPTYELRPEAGDTPDVVVENIRKLLAKAIQLSAITVGYAGPFAFDRPLGGHVHLGHSELKDSQTLRYNVANVLGGLLSPLIYVAGGTDCYLRRREDYGEPADFRIQPHGMEWRSPFSWLWDPTLAEDVLWLTAMIAGVVVQHYHERDDLRASAYSRRVCKIDSLVLDGSDAAFDELRWLAEESGSAIVKLASEIIGGDIADDAAKRIERLLSYERPFHYSNIFARWGIEPDVIVSYMPELDAAWLTDAGKRLGRAVSAYQVIFYGISSARGTVKLACNGLMKASELKEWEWTGYGRYECVPNGVVAIGIPQRYREGAGDELKKEIEELIEVAAGRLRTTGDDYAYYRMMYNEYCDVLDELDEDEDEYYDEEEIEEDDPYDSDSVETQGPDQTTRPMLLVPSTCYWNL